MLREVRAGAPCRTEKLRLGFSCTQAAVRARPPRKPRRSSQSPGREDPVDRTSSWPPSPRQHRPSRAPGRPRGACPRNGNTMAPSTRATSRSPGTMKRPQPDREHLPGGTIEAAAIEARRPGRPGEQGGQVHRRQELWPSCGRTGEDGRRTLRAAVCRIFYSPARIRSRDGDWNGAWDGIPGISE